MAGSVFGEVALQQGDERVDRGGVVGSHDDFVTVADIKGEDAENARGVDAASVRLEKHGDAGARRSETHEGCGTRVQSDAGRDDGGASGHEILLDRSRVVDGGEWCVPDILHADPDIRRGMNAEGFR
jgi:hypothetical protein